MMMTSHAVCRGVRRANRSRFLKRMDRASELETAAATPSSISNVIKISLGSGWVTPLLYAGRATSHPMGCWCNLISMKQETYNADMPFASVTKVADADFPTRWGQFRILGFEGVIENPAACNDNIPPPAVRVEGAVALVMGDIHAAPPIVRIHSQCLTGDVFHSLRCDCRQQFELAMALITDEGRGIMLYEQQEGRGIGLMAKLRAYELQDKGLDTIEANLELGYEADCRHFELPAEILKQMGVAEVRLITNNPEKVEALELAGIKVVERISAEVPSEPTNERYLQTKREKMGHLVN
jgi:GTP cyclohydrolase II